MSFSGRTVKPNLLNVWFKNCKETWPIGFCIVGACGWCAYMSGRYLITHPDVQWTTKDRTSIVRENFKEGDKWTRNQEKYVVQDVSKVGVLFSSSPKKFA